MIYNQNDQKESAKRNTFTIDDKRNTGRIFK